MADVIRKATNKFTKGLVMDFSPENTQNEVLTHALNATLLTFNGNELSLQNDMGNGRVETAFLPDGYMPVGTCEYGGIIYIVSYNPLEDKSQIGCFPSPERNISSDELGISTVKLSPSDFQKFKNGEPTGELTNTSKYVLLRNDNLNPGDKFIIHSDPEIYNEALVDLQRKKETSEYQDVPNPVIALNVVSIEDSGRIVYLNSDLRQYEVTLGQVSNTYHILGENTKTGPSGTIDIDSYRNVLSSGYNVFKSKTSGKLAILAELVTIDSYSVTHSVIPKKITVEGVTQNHEGHYDVIIHTDVTPQVTLNNFNTVPKLSYYYLSDSQGYLQKADGSIKLFTEAGYVNDKFLGTGLDEVLTPTEQDTETSTPINLDQTVSYSGKFNFPRKNTYHGRMEEHDGFITEYEGKDIYTKFTEDKYHRVDPTQVLASNGREFKPYFVRDLQAKIYKYDPQNSGYTKVETTTLDPDKTYYVATSAYVYHDAKRDKKYKDSSYKLYKNISEYVVAPDDVKNNPAIEKFREKKVYTGYPATSEDLENWQIIELYIKTADGYEQIGTEPQAGVNYYTVETDIVMESIGYTLTGQYSGVIYYCPGNKIYVEASTLDLKKYWDFDTYKEGELAPVILYYREATDSYRLATESEMLNFINEAITLYEKDDYILIHNDKTAGLVNKDEPLFVVVPMDSYVLRSEFVPNTSYNYIQGCTKPKGSNEPANGYPKDDPIVLCTVSDFVPVIYNEQDEPVVEQYPDLKLAGIKIPGILTAYGLDLPFKYSYTITPCMNYGKLKHLSVSNTVDFSNLHAFEQSNFNEWRYHLDGNQMRLTFGAEVFDTHEDYKADGLILEFYDLWGFAGSLEIANKKSYSGTFTKLISLNTIGGLSRNKVVGGGYSDQYKRNINTYTKEVEGETQYWYGESQLQYSGEETGWVGIADEDNDCGVLYSNLIYGVKAYIRRTTDRGTEFIHKKDYFLFTLPIYNDYYYTITDFSTLVNPRLEMQLTHKLVDSSTKLPYTDATNKITNGYTEDDKKTIDLFTSSEAADSFNVTKYYRYQGKSNLYIEVGLREHYKDMNLKYDPSINDYFKYNLKLVGDEDASQKFTIKSVSNPRLNPTEVLKYKHSKGTLPLDINKFGFNETHEDEASGTISEGMRYITYDGGDPLTIEYDFVVGYYVQVTDIVKKEFPTTTVCALFHETDDLQYNLEDFNIAKAIDYDNKEVYFNEGIIYNTGTRYEQQWGICEQQSSRSDGTENATASAQLNVRAPFSKEAVTISKEGVMNTGSDLESLLPFIGKLSFCQPHAHCINSSYGVNVHGDSSHSYHIIPDTRNGGYLLHDSWVESVFGSGSNDDTYGKMPMDRMYYYPLYSMVLNTVKSMEYKTEFIPTIEYDVRYGASALYCAAEDGWIGWVSCSPTRNFVGLTGAQLVTFNKKLLESMKGIYAYNPDYKTVSKLDGKTSIEDLSVQITSNLVNVGSTFELEDKTLNDFIYIGNVCISNYLDLLNQNSGIRVKSKDDKWVDAVQFVIDTTYCGSEEAPYLLTALTYNFISDASITNDFSSASTNITVRKHDRTLVPLSGTISTTALYGYDEDTGCLFQLDVSNYSIASDGKLSALSNYKTNTLEKSPNTVVPCKNITQYYSKVDSSSKKYVVSYGGKSYSSACFRGTSITVNDLVYNPSSEEHRLFVKNGRAVYNNNLPAELYYSPLDKPQSASYGRSWNYTWNDQLSCNRIFLYTGPCFTPGNL